MQMMHVFCGFIRGIRSLQRTGSLLNLIFIRYEKTVAFSAEIRYNYKETFAVPYCGIPSHR